MTIDVGLDEIEKELDEKFGSGRAAPAPGVAAPGGEKVTASSKKDAEARRIMDLTYAAKLRRNGRGSRCCCRSPGANADGPERSGQGEPAVQALCAWSPSSAGYRACTACSRACAVGAAADRCAACARSSARANAGERLSGLQLRKVIAVGLRLGSGGPLQRRSRQIIFSC